jgi:hypothetical protein
MTTRVATWLKRTLLALRVLGRSTTLIGLCWLAISWL